MTLSRSSSSRRSHVLPPSAWPTLRRSGLRAAVAAALVAAPILASSSVAWAAPPGTPAAASPADVQKATGYFVKGTELFKANKFGPALEHFKQSYSLVASPNSHLYIARCLAQLGKARDAWLEFDRTADEAAVDGTKYAKTHDSAIQERDELGPKVALVTVIVPNADANTAVRVGGYDLPPNRVGRPYPVEPGPQDVLVQAPGRPPARQSITVNLGERRDVTVSLPSDAPPPVAVVAPPPETHTSRMNGLRLGGIVAGGVGVVGFILFAAEGAASKSTYNEISQTCRGAAGCPGQTGAGRANVDSLISSGKTQQAVANAGLAIGVIGVAAGATLIALSFRKQPADAGQPTGELVLGPSWAGVRGSF